MLLFTSHNLSLYKHTLYKNPTGVALQHLYLSSQNTNKIKGGEIPENTKPKFLQRKIVQKFQKYQQTRKQKIKINPKQPEEGHNK